jgi:hypothetical protein
MGPDQLITRKPCPSCPPSPIVAAAEYPKVGSIVGTVASLPVGTGCEYGVRDKVGGIDGRGGTLIGGGAGREERFARGRSG